MQQRRMMSEQSSTKQSRAVSVRVWSRIKTGATRPGSVSVVGILFLCTLGIVSIARADDPAAHRPLPSLLKWELAPKNPVETVDRHIGHIVNNLADQQTDAPVQTRQKQVVGELDTMIKQLEEQMKQEGTGPGGPNPSKPAPKSTLAKGPGGSGPLHDPNAGNHQWAQLPPKEREQILQSQTEGFPPGYETVLSSYYSRLAQEKVASDSSSPGPTTRP